MVFSIISGTDRRIPRKRILELMTLIDEEEEPPDSIINIIFVHDKDIRNLNRRFRNLNRPTDVLSFNIDDKPGDNNIFGEIYISTDTAERFARTENVGFTAVLLRLCCHGFLHLLGYNHEELNDRQIMQSKEDYYLKKAGLCLF